MRETNDTARLKPNLPGWPIWGPEEEKALCEVVDSGNWGTLAPRVLAFAERYAQYCGTTHAIMTTSGTSSLELALRGLGISHGDEVILPLYTFAATLSAVAVVGATPVLADVELDTGVVSAATIRPLITAKTKAIMVVHLAGRPCRMDEICALAEERGIPVVEDCAQAHGARLGGKMVGSFGAAGTFSFQSSKNLTCGEGGAVVTSNFGVFAECWRYHNSGRAYEGSSEFGGKMLLGTNARMTEWQAAILDVQMDRLEAQNATRRKNATSLAGMLEKLPFITMPARPDADMEHGWHLFTLNLNERAPARDTYIEKLAEYGVPAGAGYPYLERVPFLREFVRDFDTLRLPNTQQLNRTAVWLPGRVLLAEAGEMEKVAQAMEDAFNALKG